MNLNSNMLCLRLYTLYDSIMIMWKSKTILTKSRGGGGQGAGALAGEEGSRPKEHKGTLWGDGGVL